MSDWERSSFCGNTTCVEVSRPPGGPVRVRDSKHPERQPLTFTADEWAEFVRGVQAGEFGAPMPEPSETEVQHLAEVIAEAKLGGISAGSYSLARRILDAGYRRGAGAAAALRAMADEIDRGPTFPLPPSVISALVRERADGLGGGSNG